MSNITRFEINKLYGRKSFDLKLRDNTLILVGENGAGKSTVLQLLYYFLSGQWNLILKYEFESLKITFNNKQYTLKHSDLQKLFTNKKGRDMHRLLPASVINEILVTVGSGGFPEMPELARLSERYGIPMRYLMEMVEDNILFLEQSRDKSTEQLRKLMADIKSSLNAQILFLPTYRRIEQELQIIFKGLDEKEFKQKEKLQKQKNGIDTFVELVEFGMKDVDLAIKSKVSELERFAREELNKLTISYLGNIVEHEYKSIDLSKIKKAKSEDIENVLNRIQEPILTKENKERLRNIIKEIKSSGTPDEHDRIVCHYFTKLMAFHQELEGKEANIVDFCNICNDYMVNKTFAYHPASYAFSITENFGDSERQDIKLHQLSSGEKQIVSLFSHLYLSGGSTKYFVLIDEPELSLSVPWQRMFLRDIRKAGFCAGLVAVTHSPFIYDNELKKYAHGLGEFLG